MARIIVFGVSGVGKTTACQHYVARHPNYLHLIASTLIREATGASLADLRTASIEQLLANQTVLHAAVEEKLRDRKTLNLILDGQCVLDNGDALLVLAVDSIRPFHPTGLILLEASADEIERRRAKDPKQRPYRTATQIADQLRMNREAVIGYATHLEIPFVVGEANGPSSLERPMAELSGSL